MRVFGLALLMSRERYVIGLLREADPTAASGEPIAQARRLRTAAIGLGFQPAPITGAYARQHELCLLGCIAASQRENPDFLLKNGGTIRSPA